MVSNFYLPPTGYGPGSQPLEEEDQELQYTAMPQDMRTFSPIIPDIENKENIDAAINLMKDFADAAFQSSRDGKIRSFDLSSLDKVNRAILAETLGEGEVSVKMLGIPAIAAQESVFAGIWVLKGAGLDAVEIGPTPKELRERAFNPLEPAFGALAPKIDGLANAPSIVTELMDKSATWSSGDDPHVVNLTLLPHTEPDLVWIDTALGKGSVQILSRGYGNCRVEATGQKNVWKVQFFNSMDTLILDTYEVTSVPEVAIAAPEDLADSAERIIEVMEAIR